ncbi:MAG: glycoside hydrolase family 125 protein [Rikenellaceae bacterium]|jgi:meiotically up-regulated gene 157 (Mug157) protein|nr:glycoside hydrolase family 125 protein [Rikenellaceae bacterium]
MTSKYLAVCALLFAGISTTVGGRCVAAPATAAAQMPTDAIRPRADYAVSMRPAPEKRLFRSAEVEKQIAQIGAQLTNLKLRWMFANCLPNTLDTTVHYRKDAEGRDDTFVYTGDIHAMWLRDSGAQVWPYVQFANADPELKAMLRGVIRRQIKCILLDPYANAFNDGPVGGHWMSDNTDMKPELHERKWEIDSLCYPVRLAYEYWRTTGDASVFDEEWLRAVDLILKTFREQQRRDGVGPYTFTRETDRQLDTVCNDGNGNPVNPVGLIASTFRPSDDATTFLFLVPSNFMAVSSLRKMVDVLERVNKRSDKASQCRNLALEVETALNRYAVVDHPKYGKIYAFEVDGFGNRFLMDDANVPSLLAMAYLGDVSLQNPIYRNTRRFVWSAGNPYFFRGRVAEGIGGPHIGYDMIWPMSIMMRAFTSTDDAEIKWCISTLLATDNETGFIHESFHKDDPARFTREWFAWQNTLFGELILKLVKEGKTALLNSIK